MVYRDAFCTTDRPASHAARNLCTFVNQRTGRSLSRCYFVCQAADDRGFLRRKSGPPLKISCKNSRNSRSLSRKAGCRRSLDPGAGADDPRCRGRLIVAATISVSQSRCMICTKAIATPIGAAAKVISGGSVPASAKPSKFRCRDVRLASQMDT